VTLRQRPSDLPSFSRPPVTEVVLGVRFDSPKLTAPWLGLYWASLRSRYPQVEVHPAIDPVTERFDQPVGPVGPGFRVMEKPETPRCWFLDATGNRLIQLQEDALFQNWRKVADQTVSRYEGLRGEFESELSRLDAFGRSESLGPLTPRQCEVTYINVIPTSSWGDLGSRFSVWCPTPPSFPPSEAETSAFQLGYLIPDETGKALGRLRINLQPALRKQDSARAYRLEMTARGPVASAPPK
jgi:uncharacterized protein (TIGR04255 family)